MASMFIASLTTLCPLAMAADASAILTTMDDAMNQAEDLVIDWDVTTTEPGKKSAREMSFTVQLQGEKKFTEFTAPGDIKGTKVLILNRTQMYIYLPAYRKVRRIASHVTQQGFMGTTYSHADMSATRFGDIYTGAVLSETGETWDLSLTPKADIETPYAKVELTVRKSDHLPSQIRYFNEKGAHIKTETRSDYECKGKVCSPRLLKMEDHSRGGAWTELKCKSWEVNTGLSDDLFSVRNLQRGG